MQLHNSISSLSKIYFCWAAFTGVIGRAGGSSIPSQHLKRQNPPLSPLESPNEYYYDILATLLRDPFHHRQQGIQKLPSAIQAVVEIANGQTISDDQQNNLSTAVSMLEAADNLPGFLMTVPVNWLQVHNNGILRNSSSMEAVVARLRGVNVFDVRFDDDQCSASGVERVAEVERRIDFAYAKGSTFFRLPLDTRPSGAMGNVYGEPQESQILTNDTYWSQIVEIVYHITNLTVNDNPDTHPYVDLSLWTDPSLDPPCPGTTAHSAGVPSSASGPVWQKIVSEFRENPFIIFGIANEPGNCVDNATLQAVSNEISDIISIIRTTEASAPPHLIKVPGLQRDVGLCCDRDLSWWVTNPLTGANIVYSAHYYDSYSTAAGLLSGFIPTLPVIVDELGPTASMPYEDAMYLAAWCEVQYPPVPYSFWVLASDPTQDVNLNILNTTDYTQGICVVTGTDSPSQYNLTPGYGEAAVAWLSNASS